MARTPRKNDVTQGELGVCKYKLERTNTLRLPALVPVDDLVGRLAIVSAACFYNTAKKNDN